MWGLHVAEPAMVEQVPNAIGLPEAMLVAEAQHPECKARLRQQTDDAMTCGVFGVPTMEVSDKLFWGYDDFPYLELFLEGKDPLDPTEWQRWLIPSQPSAIHRRVHPKNAGT